MRICHVELIIRIVCANQSDKILAKLSKEGLIVYTIIGIFVKQLSFTVTRDS